MKSLTFPVESRHIQFEPIFLGIRPAKTKKELPRNDQCPLVRSLLYCPYLQVCAETHTSEKLAHCDVTKSRLSRTYTRLAMSLFHPPTSLVLSVLLWRWTTDSCSVLCLHSTVSLFLALPFLPQHISTTTPDWLGIWKFCFVLESYRTNQRRTHFATNNK